ncbi:hypothetical protein BpHYR1_050035 [Brachionus plicatilis]|uniref:Uncharacterized protein n=1 Tax=Brachionus plicatilis TaxID=10195 RepID=A0A3M7PYE2_BRAPC|nr:hypothetical protein BpHYR1_050035 [Brachionus plicatilis]
MSELAIFSEDERADSSKSPRIKTSGKISFPFTKMIFCSNISVSFDFFVPPLPAYIQRNTVTNSMYDRKKEEIVWEQFNGVGFSIYLDSKLSQYSSNSLTTNGTE